MRTILPFRIVLLSLFAFILTACSLMPEGMLPPHTATVNIKADTNINPDSNNKPQPLYIMLFELKNAGTFNKVSFFDLYQQPDTTLGQNLLGLQKVYLRPGEATAVKYDISRDAKYIGMIAAYTNIDAAEWRTIVRLDSNWGNEMIWLDVHELAIKGRN